MTIDCDAQESEKEAIDELRKRFKGDMDPELHDDICLFLRFLRAQNLNVNNAEAMLRKHLEWRKKYDVVNILNFKKPEVVEKYITNVILGFDKEGCPIRYAPVGSMDFNGLLESMTPEDVTKVLIFETETETALHKQQTEKLGRPVYKCVYIHNFENFSLATATSKKVVYNLIHILILFINNYPERLKAAYAINAPVYFSFIYSVVKTILPKSVLNKVHVYSDDSYKKDLLEVIDDDVLPAFLGGSRTDPDGNPLCLSFINPVQPVPQSYYLRKQKHLLENAPDVEKITLSNASFHEVKLDVKEAGSYLEWEFETKSRDIGFGLFYSELIDGEEKITELVSIQRIDTEEYPETGTFQCERPGVYVIVFDNTYSWVRAKDVFYRTKILTPKGHENERRE